MPRKLCLGLMVFTCGWVLMGMEMVGPRLMAPVFGSDIYAWGSIISTFMVALSVGYWAGGRLTRKWNSHWTLTIIGIATSIFMLLLIVDVSYFAHGPQPVGVEGIEKERPYIPVHKWLNDRLFDFWIDTYYEGDEMLEAPNMRWPTLISSFILFFIPSALLGMASPVAIRLATQELDRVGDLLMQCNAISTAGSFWGVLITSFHLVGLYKNHHIFIAFSTVLTVAAILFGFVYPLTRLPRTEPVPEISELKKEEISPDE
ncbi:MAG: hypothetical protein O2857_02965 [Planctomycetota bacterium]|nr:hypothetical protein [Planctomycetota bacterium]